MKKVLKYIFLTLSILLNGLIIFESCLPSSLSSNRSNWWATLLADIINSTGSGKVNEVPLQELKLEGEDIIIGTSNKFEVSFVPSDTTEKDIEFTASVNNEYLNIIQEDNVAWIEAYQLHDDITITAKSKNNNKISISKNIKIIPRKKPTLFSIDNTIKEIKKGLTTPIVISDIKQDIDVNDEALNKKYENQFYALRYYDPSLISFTSSNPSVARIEGNIIRAIDVGTTIISDGSGHSIEITVMSNDEHIVSLGDDWSIKGDNIAHVYDYDYANSATNTDEFFTELSIDWGSVIPSDMGITWSSSDELIARVSNDGRVRGYKKKGKAIIRATSNFDKTYKEFEIEVKDTIPTSITIVSKLENKEIEVGTKQKVSVKFGPKNVSNTYIDISSSNESVIKATTNGRTGTLEALKKGSAVITISSKAAPEIKESITFTVINKKIIGEDEKPSFEAILRKALGHFLIFGIASIFTTITLYLFLKYKLKKKYFIPLISLGFGFFIASLSEFIQYFVPGRGASFIDVLLDTFGYLLGILICLLIYLIIYLIKRYKANKTSLT